MGTRNSTFARSLLFTCPVSTRFLDHPEGPRRAEAGAFLQTVTAESGPQTLSTGVSACPWFPRASPCSAARAQLPSPVLCLASLAAQESPRDTRKPSLRLFFFGLFPQMPAASGPMTLDSCVPYVLAIRESTGAASASPRGSRACTGVI